MVDKSADEAIEKLLKNNKSLRLGNDNSFNYETSNEFFSKIDIFYNDITKLPIESSLMI